MPASPSSPKASASADPDVLVYAGGGDPMHQPEGFRCCPLGVQLYTRKPVEEFNLLDVNFSLPHEDQANDETIQCNGVVVSCQRQEGEEELYRVWVKFLDLPEDQQRRLQCLKPSGENICPYCANYSPKPFA